MMWTRIAVLATTGALVLGVQATPALAATTQFRSCDQLHKVYKYGISRDAKAQARAVREGMYKPALRPQVYADSYKSLDRDKDGTMCEVPR